MSARRRVAILTLVTLSGVLGVTLQRVPDGLDVHWEGLHPVVLIDATESDADSTQVHRQAILRHIDRAGDTYLGHILVNQDSFLWRWPERRSHPIDVHITKWGAPGYTVEMEQAVRRAFARWEGLGGIPVRFRFLTRPAGAEVTVRWADTLTRAEGERLKNLGGYADLSGNRQGWFTSGEIWIALRHRKSSATWSPETIYQTALHEVGHLLGLGHSDDASDIMWPSARAPDLSPRDIRTARVLYGLPPGAVRAVGGHWSP